MLNLKHFSENEQSKFDLEEALWLLLDEMRELAGVPFYITSGRRSEQVNEKVGGKPNSAHLRGLAVDLSCGTNEDRKAMLTGILGVKKACFIELTSDHIHVDIDGSIHPLNQMMLQF